MDDNKVVAEQVTEQPTEQVEPKEQTFTQADIDRAVSKAIKTYSDKHAKEIENARAEGEKYAQLTAAEKEQAQLKIQREELEKSKQAFELEQLKVAIKSDLYDKGLPVEYAEDLVHLGAERAYEFIARVKNNTDRALSEAIKQNARQSTPRDKNVSINTSDRSELAQRIREKRKIK